MIVQNGVSPGASYPMGINLGGLEGHHAEFTAIYASTRSTSYFGTYSAVIKSQGIYDRLVALTNSLHGVTLERL